MFRSFRQMEGAQTRRVRMYLVIHNHHFGVDIDLEAAVLLGGLIGGA